MANLNPALSFISSVFGSAGSIGLGLYNQSQQQAENAANRKFNAEQAKLNRDFQERMFHESNAYNTPAQQVLRMKSAGLNPALMYQGSGFGAPASAPSGSSASSSSSPIPSVSGDLNIARQIAEIDLIKAQTKKTDAEGSIAISDAKIRDEFNNGLIELQGSQIRVNSSEIHLNEEQAKQYAPLCDKLQSEASLFKDQSDYYQELKSSTSEDILLKQIERSYKSQFMESQIESLRAKSSLDYAQTREVLVLLNLKAANLSADTLLKSKLAETELSKYSWFNSQSGLIDEMKANEVLRRVGIKIENQQMKFDFEQSKTYDSLERQSRIAYNYASAGSHLIEVSVNTKGRWTKPPKVGFAKPSPRTGYPLMPTFGR